MELEYGKKELEQIAKLYGIKGAYKMKKAELVAALKEAIPKGLKEALIMLDIEDIEKLEAIMKQEIEVTGETIEPYFNLMELELVQLKKKEDIYLLKVDETVKEAYKALDREAIKRQIRENTKLRNYVIAILNLYGMVSIDWAVKLYKMLYGEELEKKELINFVKKDMRLAYYCKVMTDYIVQETIYGVDKENFEDFYKARIDRDYFVPSKELLEKLRREDYYEENSCTERFRTYARKYLNVDDEQIEEALGAITLIARIDCDKSGQTMEMMLEELEDIGFIFEDFRQVEEMIKHVNSIVNQTRKWINKGFTNVELSPYILDDKTGQKMKIVDIGRNQACPCGSGKKYKKCCGK